MHRAQHWLKNWFKNTKQLIKDVWKDIVGSLNEPKPIAVITFAVLLIAVGQIGIIVPIFPGLAFTIPGLIILSLYSPTIYRVLKHRVAGHPRIESLADRTRNWLINRIRPRQ